MSYHLPSTIFHRPWTIGQVRSKAGFTLLELLVAMGLLVLLGLLLSHVLSKALQLWRISEDQSTLHSAAAAVFNVLREDLEAVYTRPDNTGEVCFLLDVDVQGRQRLRFIRTLAEEERHPVLRQAGTVPGQKAPYTLHEQNGQNLRAAGGLAEVLYLIEPTVEGSTLWRAQRSPIGGTDSLFRESSIATAESVAARAYPLARRVLFWGVKCWTPMSTTWDSTIPPAVSQTVSGGPSLLWDSSRRQLTEFYLHQKQIAGVNAVVPGKLEITLILADPRAPATTLTAALTATDREIRVRQTQGFPDSTSPHRYLRLEREWVRYEQRKADRFLVVARGQLGTVASAHPAAITRRNVYYDPADIEKKKPIAYEISQPTPVVSGTPFVVVYAVPTHRE